MKNASSLGRRRFLVGAAAATTGFAFAGCIEGPGGDDIESGTGYAAFFTLADWGNQVGGDTFEFEDPVEAGEMGHGWDPDFDVISKAASREVFLYLDTPEFAWAQDIAETLESDHEAVNVLNGLTAIPEYELLTFAETREIDGDPDDDVDPSTFEVGSFDLVDPHDGDIPAWWHDGHWHGGIPTVPLDDERSLRVHIEGIDGRIPPLDADSPFELSARPADDAPEVFEAEVSGDHVTLSGIEEGQSLIVFELTVEGGDDFDTTSDPATVTVSDDIDQTGDVFYDPHTWVDPALATEIVSWLGEELGEIDPDNADAYEANAAAYIDEIEQLESDLAALVAGGDTNHVVFAGHHSFGYVANRYNLEFHTPVGIAPDAEVTQSDVSGLIRVIQEHDLDTVLYDPFEAPDPDHEVPPMVDVIVEETGVTPEPLSAAEGTTPQWRDAGYGWLEQWTEINLPSLEAALSTEEG